ncbi:hypothetical protein [Flammeovirga sp. SJP92]|uniref:hypothetical protein n=1 Tax=Flammeovirga sp. SJP92 TaxID=1775430 RepID=UPI000792E67C|nr:hypothetical protein [Flammeovirga sp. SJP92]KXX68548.1 hypothetical protein AVL50_22565 [Flammeovirga sp. SJP92]
MNKLKTNDLEQEEENLEKIDYSSLITGYDQLDVNNALKFKAKSITKENQVSNQGDVHFRKNEEPIPSWRRWSGDPRKESQWFGSAGVYDEDTFNKAAIYNTEKLNSDAYQTVYQRNAYYEWVQNQIDSKKYNSKWFAAAELVTGFRGVGGSEIPDWNFFSDSKVDSFLQGGNEFLFAENMKNAKDILKDGKLNGHFIDAFGEDQSFDDLTGIKLDFKMVEFEQSKVQEYIKNYKGNDLGEIISGINDLMSSWLGPGEVQDVMKDHFEGGKTFDFKNYKDRVKLGKELIRKLYNEKSN